MKDLAIKRRHTPSIWDNYFIPDSFLDTDWMGRWEKGFPAVNIAETADNYSIDVVVPGYKKNEIKVKVDDDTLTISAEAHTDRNTEQSENQYRRQEYRYSTFTRSFKLPDNIKDDDITANYTDGILRLTMPKSQAQVKATKEIRIT